MNTLVPGAVQHVRQTGYPSTRRVKENKAVKKSVDVNEKPHRKKGRVLSTNNPKPTKAQLLAKPITHTLYFKADESFERREVLEENHKILHKIRVVVCTPSGRKLDFEETLGKIVVLDYNKSILSANFNPSKFDFNPYDMDLKGPAISFRLYNCKMFQVKEGERLGCAALIPTVGVPNWPAKCCKSTTGTPSTAKDGLPCPKLGHPGLGHAFHGLAPHQPGPHALSGGLGLQ